MPTTRPLSRRPWRALALFAALAAPVAAPAQSRIENTATLRWSVGGAVRALRSNTVALDLARAQRPTGISFRLLPIGFRLTGMQCRTQPDIQFTPAPIDAATLAAAAPLARLDIKEPLIIVLDAVAENRDPAVREQVSLDVEAGPVRSTLPLTETAPDSGVFAGGVPAVGMDDIPELAPCDLKLAPGDRFSLGFAGNDDSAPSRAELLVDPVGTVFDSQTGRAVDGATVELVDVQGRPASVFGDDGVSAYPASMVSGTTVTDASGRIYPGRPGYYRFPFAPPGDYRLRVTPPAPYTAPSVVEPGALAALGRRTGQAFTIAAASYGGVLTLIDDPVAVDIPLDPPTSAALLLTKVASLREASPGDAIQYRLRVTNRDAAPARGLQIADTLPPGLGYRRGSTRGGAEPAVGSDGRGLAFTLPDLAPGASAELTYSATVRPGAPVGEALNRARVTGFATASNEAAASVRLRPLLFTDALTVIGRVTEGACGDPVARRRGIAGIRLLLEDGTSVVTDRDGLYHLEGLRPGTHVVQLDAGSIPASHRAVACDVDSRQANNPLSRFVEGAGGLVKRVDFQLAPTGEAAAATSPLPVAVPDDATAAGNRDWLAGQRPGVEWLFPEVNHNPRAPALRIVVKHRPGQRVALTVNGQPSDPINFDGTDAVGAVAISRWTGVPLPIGDTRLEARVLAADGGLVATLDRIVHYGGAPASVAVDPGHSRLAADGLSTPLVAIRVLDAAGRPVRAGTPVSFRVAAPYAAGVDRTVEQARRLTGGSNGGTPARVVGDEGYAFLPLAPTAQAGAAQLQVTLADERGRRTVPVQAWLSASARDWVVVGFGRGSLGWQTLRRHVRPLAQADRPISADGQVALYAKGRVRGSWLLTIAYDSDRKATRERGLLGTIDPDRYYTVYGDGAEQRYDAASRRPLYLRLERRQFYALFGDFETGLADAQLTRYVRTLNGGKAAYEGEHVRATAVVARTDAAHARDEIRGLGLTGPYRLSRRGIIANTDRIAIQVRDRFRPELVKSETALVRHIDYDIDIDLGTIRFRTPVLSRTTGLDPVVIVADYEVEQGRTGRTVAAGRVAARLLDRRLEIGLAAIRDRSENDGAVAGLDLRFRPTPATEVRAEAARGGRFGLGDGFAYLVEADHHATGLDLSAYMRRQDLGFGIGQQNLVEAGTRRTGLDARIQLAPALTLTGSGWYQEQLGGPGRRVAGDARLEWRRDATTLFVGTQLAQDRGIDGGDRRSALLTLGGSRALLGDRLTLTGQTQVAPGGDKGAADFPARHQLSAAFRVLPGVRLIGGYELAQGATYTARTVQGGVDLSPWTGGKLAATLNGQAAGENGERTFAQYGISQSLPIGARWTVDASLDAATTIRGRIDGGAAITPFQSAGSGILGQDALSQGGGGSFTAVTLGTAYRGPQWGGNVRLEYRSGDTADRWGLTGNLLRTLGEGRTLAGGVRAYRVAAASGAVASYGSADLALAWRPLDSRWSVLDRLEVRRERADAGVSDGNVVGVPALAAAAGDAQGATRVVNNLSVNWRSGPEGLGHGVEATLYHGAKYVRGRYGDDRFDGFIDATGLELRADIHPRVDIGVQASAQHAWTTGSWAWSGGPSLGVSPGRDIWVSTGVNVRGYRDRDFEAERYTRAGPYVTLRMKFDRATFGRGR